MYYTQNGEKKKVFLQQEENFNKHWLLSKTIERQHTIEAVKELYT